MEVPSYVKKDYKDDSITKTLVIEFPDLSLTVPTEEVYSESMRLYESILEHESIEFVGCIASKFEVQIRNTATYQKVLKGQRIVASIYTENTENYPIPLFHGIVDECKKEINKQYVKITAYDELYTKGNIDVSSWYKNLHFPITLGNLRTSLLSTMGLTCVECTLPNDNVSISKQYNPESLQSLVVLKSICQINGCFGIINRDGLFEFRFLEQTLNAIYPSINLIPSSGTYPGGESESPYEDAEIMSYYRTLEYQDFDVKPVDKITIRQKENDKGVTYGSGDNNYIIQANMFTYKLSNTTLKTVAKNIYSKVGAISYSPYQSVSNGLPYAECGKNAVAFYYSPGSQEPTQNKDFYIFNRELTGIQALKDNYESKGEEYQNEFITDINSRVRTIQSSQNEETIEYDDKFDAIDSEFTDVWNAIESGGNFNIVSTNGVPSSPLPNTLYCIQGEIISVR